MKKPSDPRQNITSVRSSRMDEKNSVQALSTRYRLLGVLLAAAVHLLSSCSAQEPKTYHVGIVVGLDANATIGDGFRAGMTDLGYIEGKNIVYEVHQLNFDYEAGRRILRQLVLNKVDAIIAMPTEVAIDAKEAVRGTSVPVVFCQTNIEGSNLVKSVREPGGNITGVRSPGPDVAVKRFEVLHELLPHAKRIWLPYWKYAEIVPSQLELLRPAALKAGVTLVEIPAENAADLEKDLEARGHARRYRHRCHPFYSRTSDQKPVCFSIDRQVCGRT